MSNPQSEFRVKENDLVIQQKRGKWVAYFRGSQFVAIGETKKESLEILNELINIQLNRRK